MQLNYQRAFRLMRVPNHPAFVQGSVLCKPSFPGKPIGRKPGPVFCILQQRHFIKFSGNKKSIEFCEKLFSFVRIYVETFEYDARNTTSFLPKLHQIFHFFTKLYISMPGTNHSKHCKNPPPLQPTPQTHRSEKFEKKIVQQTKATTSIPSPISRGKAHPDKPQRSAARHQQASR